MVKMLKVVIFLYQNGAKHDLASRLHHFWSHGEGHFLAHEY